MSPSGRKPGRRATVPVTVELPDDGTDDTAVPGALDDDVQAVEELAELSAQLPEDASLALYRMLDGADKEFCDQMAVRDFSIAAVAARFGGGRYTIYLRKPDPERAGKWIRQGSKRFRVAGAARTGADVGAPMVAGGTPGIGEAEKVLRTYGDLIQSTVKSSLENQNLLQQMQLAVVTRLAERPPDTTMELLKVLLPALLGGRGDQLTMADVLALADRMASKTSPTTQLRETLGLVKDVRELGGDGGGEPAPAWLTVASRALGLFERAYQPPAPGDAPRALPPGAPIPETPAAPAGGDVHPLITWLAPQVPGLIRHAELDHDPDTYAGVICDQIAPEHAADAIAFLTAPHFLTQLGTAFPGVVPVQSWFSELRDDVVTRLQEMLAPPADPEPEPPQEEM